MLIVLILKTKILRIWNIQIPPKKHQHPKLYHVFPTCSILWSHKKWRFSHHSGCITVTVLFFCWCHSLKAVGTLSGDIGVWKQNCQGDLNQWALAIKCPAGKGCPTKIEYHSFRCLLLHCGRVNAKKKPYAKVSVECVLGDVVNWPGMVFGGYWFVLVVHLSLI